MTRWSALCCIALILGSATSTMSQSHKPRLIVTTDINNGPGDPDDRQSLCHLVLYADVLDIRGSVPDRFSPKAIETCHIAFDLYEEDFNRPGTRFGDDGFPQADFFRDRRSRQHRKPR